MSKPSRDISLKRKVEEAFSTDAEELVDSPLLETSGKRRHKDLIDDSDEDDDSESYFQGKRNKPGPSRLHTQAKRDSSSHTMNIKPDMPDFATPDECLFGSIVANRLKRLAEDQKIYAEKIISDALHYAMLNRLSSASNVTL